MTQLDHVKKLNWYWNGKSIPLIEMHPNQIAVVKKLVHNSSRNWFNVSSDAWTNAIRYIENKKSIVEIDNHLNKYAPLSLALQKAIENYPKIHGETKQVANEVYSTNY